jgi:hypothetical protein
MRVKFQGREIPLTLILSRKGRGKKEKHGRGEI